MSSTSLRPAPTASSTTYWMAGLSTTGSISLGVALVAGRNLVPRPAAGVTALVTSLAAVSAMPEPERPPESDPGFGQYGEEHARPPAAQGRTARPDPRPAVRAARGAAGR